jgi:hypothetical protein
MWVATRPITHESVVPRWLHVALTLAAVLCVTSNAFAYACPQNPPPPKTETYQGFLGRVQELNGQQMPYRLFVPKDYDPNKAYPLVLHLHHAGLAGTDSHNETGWDNCVQLTSEMGSGDDYGGVFTNRAVDKDGNRFDTQERYPHFVLAPHANSPAYGFGGGGPGSATGPEPATRAILWAILDAVRAEFNIDSARLYVTGVSMGCYGTWDIIMRKPGVFAAASPQSCRGDPDQTLLTALKDMPIWSMCGTSDSYFSGAQAMADGMKAVGATSFKFTAMEGVGHSINDRGYDYPGFIDWMFAQRLPGAQPPGTGGAGGMAGAPSAGGAAGSAGASSSQAGQPIGGADVGSAGANAIGGSGSASGASASNAGASGQAGGAPAAAPIGSNDVSATESSCSIARARASGTPLALLLTLSLGAVAWRRSEKPLWRRARRRSARTRFAKPKP